MPPHYIKKQKKEGWYLRKLYPHFDVPLSFNAAKGFVEDANQIASHAFLPFLSYTKQVRRFRGPEDKTIKRRPIETVAEKLF